MRQLSNIATWVQRCALFLVIPIIFVMRMLSWTKIKGFYFIDQPLFVRPIENDIQMLPATGKFLYFVLESFPTLMLLAALRYFWLLLNLYKKDMHFSGQAVQLLKKINIIILIWALYQLFFDILASLAISLFKPAGQRYLLVTVEVDDIMRFFAVLILFMVLRVVQEAHRIKSEQDLVV